MEDLQGKWFKMWICAKWVFPLLLPSATALDNQAGDFPAKFITHFPMPHKRQLLLALFSGQPPSP